MSRRNAPCQTGGADATADGSTPDASRRGSGRPVTQPVVTAVNVTCAEDGQEHPRIMIFGFARTSQIAYRRMGREAYRRTPSGRMLGGLAVTRPAVWRRRLTSHRSFARMAQILATEVSVTDTPEQAS